MHNRKKFKIVSLYNGVCNGVIFILKWDKILVNVMELTNASRIDRPIFKLRISIK